MWEKWNEEDRQTDPQHFSSSPLHRQFSDLLQVEQNDLCYVCSDPGEETAGENVVSHCHQSADFQAQQPITQISELLANQVFIALCILFNESLCSDKPFSRAGYCQFTANDVKCILALVTS